MSTQPREAQMPTFSSLLLGALWPSPVSQSILKRPPICAPRAAPGGTRTLLGSPLGCCGWCCVCGVGPTVLLLTSSLTCSMSSSPPVGGVRLALPLAEHWEYGRSGTRDGALPGGCGDPGSPRWRQSLVEVCLAFLPALLPHWQVLSGVAIQAFIVQSELTGVVGPENGGGLQFHPPATRGK